MAEIDRHKVFVLAVLASSIVRDVQEQRQIAGEVVIEATRARIPEDAPLDALVREFVEYEYGDTEELGWPT